MRDIGGALWSRWHNRFESRRYRIGIQSGSSNWLRRFPLLQATLRRGSSCLDIGVARWDSAVQAQMGGGTLQESGKFL